MASGVSLPSGKLKLLALHSFRTSAKTFQEQVRRSGLDRKLDHLVELVYLDAPHAATGPPPADVAPFFEPPYREWWNTEKNEETGEYEYRGGKESLAFVRKVIVEQGPFDGLWAFSQGSMLASLIMALFCQERLPFAEMEKAPRFCVLFGGFFDKEKMKANKVAREIFGDIGPLPCPSLHMIGERDALRKFSLMLTERYKDPLVIKHPRGHVIPALDEASFGKVEAFLQEQLLHGRAKSADGSTQGNGSKL